MGGKLIAATSNTPFILGQSYDLAAKAKAAKGAHFKAIWGKTTWYYKVGNKDVITQICSD